MKGLPRCFDTPRFLEGKELQVTECRAWNEFETKKPLGTRVEVVIISDKTDYGVSSSGSVINNLYEKMVLKTERNITIPVGALVKPVNATATVYGERFDKLSIKCDDIKVVSQPKG